MIRLEKGPKPDVLIANETVWRDEYLAARVAPPVSKAIRFRYRNTHIKQALREEAHTKCVYCERKVSPGETDHILPVDAKPELIVDWDNLALACKDCNTNKGEYFSEAEPLINPFALDPAPHLFIFGPLVLSKVGSQLGFRTVEKIRLRRPELVERRAERIEIFQGLLEHWHGLGEGPTKELAKQKILEEAGVDREFTAVVRTYLYQELGWVAPSPDP